MIRTRRLVYHTGDFQLAAPFFKGSKSGGRILKTLRLAAFRVKNIQMGIWKCLHRWYVLSSSPRPMLVMRD